MNASIIVLFIFVTGLGFLLIRTNLRIDRFKTQVEQLRLNHVDESVARAEARAGFTPWRQGKNAFASSADESVHDIIREKAAYEAIDEAKAKERAERDEQLRVESARLSVVTRMLTEQQMRMDTLARAMGYEWKGDEVQAGHWKKAKPATQTPRRRR